MTIQLLKVYAKDLSFESPYAPNVFQENIQPKLEVRFEMKQTKLASNQFEVNLVVTIEAKGENDQIVFIVEVDCAGLFEIKELEEEALKKVLTIYCPNQVFPYLRQTVDQLLNAGGFPPLMLAPINFEQMVKSQSS